MIRLCRRAPQWRIVLYKPYDGHCELTDSWDEIAGDQIRIVIFMRVCFLRWFIITTNPTSFPVHLVATRVQITFITRFSITPSNTLRRKSTIFCTVIRHANIFDASLWTWSYNIMTWIFNSIQGTNRICCIGTKCKNESIEKMLQFSLNLLETRAKSNFILRQSLTNVLNYHLVEKHLFYSHQLF